MTSGPESLAIGVIGASYTLILLFYTTGILLNYTRFTGTDLPPYMDRLRDENAFRILLLCTIGSGIGLGLTSILRLLDHVYAADTLIAASVPFLGGLLYFVRRMHTVTRPT